jgi:L1 cell adhesion molecule
MPMKWLALECIHEKIFTHKSDVWAFGVTIWEILTFGDKPYKGVNQEEMLNVLDRGERLPQPKICSLDLFMILVKCWMVDAENRPAFRELKDLFAKFASDPPRYLAVPNDKMLREPSFSQKDERQALAEWLRSEIPEDPAQQLVQADEYFNAFASDSSPSSSTQPVKFFVAVCILLGGWKGWNVSCRWVEGLESFFCRRMRGFEP